MTVIRPEQWFPPAAGGSGRGSLTVCQCLGSLPRVSDFTGFSLLEQEVTNKPEEETRMIYVVIDQTLKHH